VAPPWKHGEYVLAADLIRVLAPFKWKPNEEQYSASGRRSAAFASQTANKWATGKAPPAVDEVTVLPYTPQVRLSERTGLSVQVISKYLNGRAGEWIPLDRADLLLTGAGMQHHFLIDVPVYTFERGVMVTNEGESAKMAAEQSTGSGLYWCTECQQVRNEGEVTFYVDLGRMDLKCRSGRVQPLEQAKALGLVPQPG
jgi:hypothetical protein